MCYFSKYKLSPAFLLAYGLLAGGDEFGFHDMLYNTPRNQEDVLFVLSEIDVLYASLDFLSAKSFREEFEFAVNSVREGDVDVTTGSLMRLHNTAKGAGGELVAGLLFNLIRHYVPVLSGLHLLPKWEPIEAWLEARQVAADAKVLAEMARRA